MSRTKAAGLAVVGLAILGLMIPTSAGASTGTDQTTEPASDVVELIVNDPNARYVSVAEADQQYGVQEHEVIEAVAAPQASEPVITPFTSWGGCDYDGRADYPHVTRGEASVHGYWVKTGGTCPTTAKVTVDLQALLCSGNFGCTWITQKTDSGTFNSGSGTGKWATPHKACANSNLVGWRGQVDVDLTNWADPYGYHYGPAKDLNCSPA